MADKNYIDTFQSEHKVLDKVDELKGKGFLEDDICVVTNDTESLYMIWGQADVDLRSSDRNWMDQFKAFLSKDDPVKAALINIVFIDEEFIHYYNKVKENEILLYVDRDYNPLVHTPKDGFINDHMEANLSSNLTVDNTTNVHDNINI